MDRGKHSLWSGGLRVGVASLLAASALLLTTSRATMPVASADDEDPRARVVLFITNIHVYDNGDEAFESGEDTDTLRFQRTAPGCGGICHGPFLQGSIYINAEDDTDYAQQVQIPPARGHSDQYYITPEPGLDIYSGMSLEVKWRGEDDDPIWDDDIGNSYDVFTEAQNWGIGKQHVANANNCLGCGGFEVTYEVRKASLPDFKITNLRTGKLNTGASVVCVTTQNAGTEPANGSSVHFYVDGQLRRGDIQESRRLNAGASYDSCFETGMDTGQHNFRVVVDEDRVVPESDELNNAFQIASTFARLGASDPRFPVAPVEGIGILEPLIDPGTTEPPVAPPTTSNKADLTTSDLRVKGKAPSGNNDCDPGKNDVTVTVKNTGARNLSRSVRHPGS